MFLPISIYFYIFLFISIYIDVFLSIWICLKRFPSVPMYLYLFPSISVYVCPQPHPPPHPHLNIFEVLWSFGLWGLEIEDWGLKLALGVLSAIFKTSHGALRLFLISLPLLHGRFWRLSSRLLEQSSIFKSQKTYLQWVWPKNGYWHNWPKSVLAPILNLHSGGWGLCGISVELNQ